MAKLNQGGGLNALLLPLMVTILLLIGAVIFGFWAYGGRQDYKNNVDQKVAEAVTIAKQEAATAKDNEFAEKEKSPLKDYKGPSTYGSIVIAHPKTWSAYVNETGGSTPLDGYFHPGFVPSVTGQTPFALRLSVTSATYDQELRKFDALAKGGKVKVSPFRAAQVGNVLGSRIDGEIESKKTGSMILLPLRDKTIKLWTEANEFSKDFNDIILPSLLFIP